MITESLQHDFADWLRENRQLKPRTVEAYLSDLAALDEYLTSKRVRGIRGIRATHIIGFLEQQRRLGKKPATICRQSVAVRGFLHWVACAGFAPVSSELAALKWPSPDRPTPEVLAPKEIDAFLASVTGNDVLATRDRAMLEVACRCGVTESELLAIKAKHVRQHDGMTWLHVRSASGRKRAIPMTAECAKCLDLYKKRARPLLVDSGMRTDALFLNHMGHPMSRMGYWKIVQKWAELSGVRKRIKPSTLRHSFAFRLLSSGAHIDEIGALLGHANLSATLIYLRFDLRRITAQYKKAQHRKYHPRG